ncbi:MAG: hypothetical protein VX112_03915 [Pseudomonadota bacterium]|nr:hypothetical protein [Pseudomonadota bacterium]
MNSIPDSLSDLRGLIVISVIFFTVLAINLSALFSIYVFLLRSRVFLEPFADYAKLNFGVVWLGVQVIAVIAASSYLIYALCQVFFDVQDKLTTKLKPSFTSWRTYLQMHPDSKHEKGMYVRKKLEVIYFTMLIALFVISSIAHALSIVSTFCLIVIKNNINAFSPLGSLLGFGVVLTASSLMVQVLLRSAYIRTRRFVIDKIANFITFNTINKPVKKADSRFKHPNTTSKDISTQTDLYTNSGNLSLGSSRLSTPRFHTPSKESNNLRFPSHNSDFASFFDPKRDRSNSDTSLYSLAHNNTPKSPPRNNSSSDATDSSFNVHSLSRSDSPRSGLATARCSPAPVQNNYSLSRSNSPLKHFGFMSGGAGRESPHPYNSGVVLSPRSFNLTPSTSSSEDLYRKGDNNVRTRRQSLGSLGGTI